MTLPASILLVLALFMLQLFLQETSRYGFDIKAITGNRDQPPEMTVVAARLDRAKNNMIEALPLFLGLSLLAMALGKSDGLARLGAMIFLLARLAYVPAYVSGLPWLRSLFWLAANAGLVLIAFACM